MSFELAYHPPKGSKWIWFAKALNYSPWGCNLLAQKEKDLRHGLWPLACTLWVDLIDGQYCWTISTTDFNHSNQYQTGQAKTALQAIRAAERVGERWIKQQIPRWVRTALQHGWRSPA